MVDVATAEAELKARTALSSSPIYDLRRLNVEREGDRLLISGHVNTFYHKQLATELVRAVAGHMHLVNSIDVSTADFD